MRLTDIDDTDIALDGYFQPSVDEGGSCRTVSGSDCWAQDTYLEMLTEEGELLHEDEEGRWAYGFGLRTIFNGEDTEENREEIYARVREKLTKRDYIDPESIKVTMLDTNEKGVKLLRISFSDIDDEEEVNKDIRIEGAEVTIE